MPGRSDVLPAWPLSSCPSVLSPQDSSVGPDGCASDPRAPAPADPALAADAAAGTASMAATPAIAIGPATIRRVAFCLARDRRRPSSLPHAPVMNAVSLTGT